MISINTDNAVAVGTVAAGGAAAGDEDGEHRDVYYIADKILSQIKAEERSFDDLNKFGLYPSGGKVTDTPEILFARLKLDEVLAKLDQ